MSVTETARFEARLPRHVLELVKNAAALQGRTLTDFVVTAAQEYATRVISDANVIKLTQEQQIRFAEAMLQPPEPAAALLQAQARHREMVRE